jgi:hypothetical protein
LADEFCASRHFEVCSVFESTEEGANLAGRVSAFEAWISEQSLVSEVLGRDFGVS